MKMIRWNTLLVVLIALVVISGCKKDEDEPSGGPEGYVAPVFASQEEILKVPAAIETSNDPYLAYAQGMLATINAYSSYMNNLVIPSGAEEIKSTKSTTRTWQWTYGQFTMWVEFTEGDLSYEYVLYYQDGQTFITKTKILEATQTKLGTSGQLKFYAGYEVAMVTYTWEKVGSTVNASLLYGYGLDAILMTVTADEDGSGELDIYEGSTTGAPHIFHVEWNTSGHGSWWYVVGQNEYTGTF